MKGEEYEIFSFSCHAGSRVWTGVQADTGTSAPAAFMDQFSVHGTLTLSSDYRSRGFSKSSHKPSVQGGMILAHQSGAYLMLWGASATTPNGGSMEADAIVGYTWRIDDKNSLDFFYADVNYPGGISVQMVSLLILVNMV